MTERRAGPSGRVAISGVALAVVLLLAQLTGLPLPGLLERVAAGLVLGWGLGVPLLARLSPAEPSLVKLFVLGGVLSPTLAALGYAAALAAGLESGSGPGLRALTVVYALAIVAGLAAVGAGRRVEAQAGERAASEPGGIGRALGAASAVALVATLAAAWLLLARPDVPVGAPVGAPVHPASSAHVGALLPGGLERLAVVESLRRGVPPENPFVAAAPWERPFSSEAMIALVGDALLVSDGVALSLLAVLLCGLLPLLVYFCAAPAWQNGPCLVLGVALCTALWLSNLATWSSGAVWPASWAGLLVLAGCLCAAHAIRHGRSPWPLLVGLFHGLAVLVEPWVGLSGAGAVAVAALLWRAAPEAAPRTLLALSLGVLPPTLGLRATGLWHAASFEAAELDRAAATAAWPLPSWLTSSLPGWAPGVALAVLMLSALLGGLALRATRGAQAAAWPGRRAVVALLALEALALGAGWTAPAAAALQPVLRLLGALPLLLLAAGGPLAIFVSRPAGAARWLGGGALGALLMVLVADPPERATRGPDPRDPAWRAEFGAQAAADLAAALGWLKRERSHFEQDVVLAWNPDVLPPFPGVARSGLAALSGLGLWAIPEARFDDADPAADAALAGRAGPRCAGLRRIYSTPGGFDDALFEELDRLDRGLVLIVTARDRRDFPWLLNKLRPRGFGVLRVEGSVDLFAWPRRLADGHPNAERRFPEEHVGARAPAVYGEPR